MNRLLLFCFLSTLLLANISLSAQTSCNVITDYSFDRSVTGSNESWASDYWKLENPSDWEDARINASYGGGSTVFYGDANNYQSPSLYQTVQTCPNITVSGSFDFDVTDVAATNTVRNIFVSFDGIKLFELQVTSKSPSWDNSRKELRIRNINARVTNLKVDNVSYTNQVFRQNQLRNLSFEITPTSTASKIEFKVSQGAVLHLDNVVLAQEPPTLAAPTATAINLCSGTADLTKIQPTPPENTTILWYRQLGDTPSSIDPIERTPSAVETGKYYMKAKSDCNNCKSEASAVVTVSTSVDSPVVTNNLIANSCPNEQGDLTSVVTSTPPSGYSVKWFTDLALTTQYTGSLSSVPTGTYYVAYENNISGCKGPAESISVITTPCCKAEEAPTTVANTTIENCPTKTGDLTTLVSSTPPTSDIEITYHTGFPATDANKVATPTAASPGVYYAAFYDKINLCYGAVSAPLYVANCAHSCYGDVVNLNDYVTNNAPVESALEWHTSKSVTTTTKVVDPTQVAVGGIYWPVYYDATRNCYSPVGNPLKVTISPEVTLSIVATNQLICEGQTAEFTVQASGSAVGGTLTYVLGGVQATTTISDTVVNFEIENAQTGNSSLNLISIVTQDGCEYALTNTATVAVSANPVCTITGRGDALCPTSTEIYTAPSGMSAYEWTVAGNASISGANNAETVTVVAGELSGNSFTLTLRTKNANGCTSTCTKTVAVSDNENPSFSVPANVAFCVENIQQADFDEIDDIKPDRPEYYLFESGDTALDLDATTFTDNCCTSASMTLSWTITFDGGTPEAVSGTGQPSTHGTAIQLSGDGVTFTDKVHTITYRLEDCNGNFTEKTTQITIKPRPKIEKLNN